MVVNILLYPKATTSSKRQKSTSKDTIVAMWLSTAFLFNSGQTFYTIYRILLSATWMKNFPPPKLHICPKFAEIQPTDSTFGARILECSALSGCPCFKVLKVLFYHRSPWMFHLSTYRFFNAMQSIQHYIFFRQRHLTFLHSSIFVHFIFSTFPDLRILCNGISLGHGFLQYVDLMHMCWTCL